MSDQTLNGKVALVTGAARRIGAEIITTLHEAGMNVIVHYHTSKEEAITLCHQLNEIRKHSAALCQANLHEIKSIPALIQNANQEWGRLDVLVNNASRFYRTDMGKITEHTWHDLMTSNLQAPFFLAQAASPLLAIQQGCIVNITDIHAERPLKNHAVYCIAKSALTMMTKVLAKELGPKVRVNAVAPGAIVWPEGENVLPDAMKQKIIDRTLLSRSGEPGDVAKAVLFFVRDGNYVTGQVLNIDGGRSLSG